MTDQRLAELRDAVRTVVEPVALEQQVSFTRIVERAGRRRRRAAMLASVAALAAVGALLIRTTTDRARPVTTANPARHGPTLEVLSLAFGTAEHGFATVQRCAGAEYRCATHATLLRTDNGARTWTQVPSPADNGPADDTLVFAAPETSVVVLRVGSSMYASPDGGRHWTAVPEPRAGHRGPATEAAPVGWMLVLDPAGRVVALDPMTGEQRPLVNQPGPPVKPADGPTFDRVYDTAGHRMVLTRTTGRSLTLAYTDDRGRTWHPLPAPPGAPGAAHWLLTDPASERIYLASGDKQWQVLRLWRLDRAGARWVRVPVPREIAGVPDRMDELRMLPDGELACMVNPLLRTENDGTRVVRVPEVHADVGRPSLVEELYASAGGTLYYAPPTGTSAPGTLRLLVSTDSGRTWTTRESRP